MEEKLNRLVSLGEVFIKTHTKPDGTYVDRKAEMIDQNYEKNLHEKLSQLEGETSSISDGASRPRELTTEEYTAIFLQSTVKDSRGSLYGVGSLKDAINNLTCKNKQQEESISFVALHEQLKEAHRKIKEQASRFMAEQKSKLHLRFYCKLVEKYLRQTDPAFLNFIAVNASSATASTTPTYPDPVSSPPDS